MILRSFRPRATISLSFPRRQLASPPRRTLIPAPTSPPMSRRSDRALPPLPSNRIWFQTFPIFIAIMTAATLGIFNYQKASSSVVASTLYALRTSEVAREELGDEIYFRDKFPWIWGKMNQLHGRIDICFAVKGTKSKGLVRFRSFRRTRMGYVRFPRGMTKVFTVASILT